MKKKLKINIESIPRIYVSAAMRSGSSLISNILNAHTDINIIENFHFKRFIYQNGERLTKNLLNFKVKEMNARLNLRYNYKLNPNKIIKNTIRDGLSYRNLYNNLIQDQIEINQVKIVGEDSAMNWRFIEKFYKMYKNARIIHIIRDPRSIFASWKKATYQKNDYWGCIFNCYDNMKYAEIYKKKLNKKKYMVVKFEDILKNPKKFAIDVSNFLNIEFQTDMIKPYNWKKKFNNKSADLGWSSIEKKRMDGFYKNRIDSWKTQLTASEIFINELFLRKQLKNWRYKPQNPKINSEDLNLFFNNLKKSKYLSDLLGNYIQNDKGSDKLKDDPTDYKTWSGGRVNKKRFANTKKGVKYVNILKELKKKYL